jgi:AcrR family transcriptional regulator
MTSDQTGTESDHRAGTRERLLDVAERIFAERGFAGASVREITEAAGASLAAINYHFHSKEKLYAEVFLRRMDHLRDQFLAQLRSDIADDDLDGALTSFGRAFISPHADPAFSWRFLDLCSRELIEAQLPPGLLERELVTPLIESIVGFVRRARPELDQEVARSCAHSFLAQLLQLVRGARVAARSDAAAAGDERLAHVVRFTAAAIRHI